MELLARRYDTAQPVRLEIVGDRIAQVVPVEMPQSEANALPWVSPGLFDVQVNGYGGQEFSSSELTTAKVAEIAEQFTALGVTRFCPTLTTNAADVLRHALRTIDAACGESPSLARKLPGVHLEGPFISPQAGPRGAHPLAHCRQPDWDEFQRFQQAAGGRIRILTMSVEFDRSWEFVERAVRSGLLVAIGHTAAEPGQIRRAVDAGARLSTHLGNGCHAMLHRHSNYLWEQLADDRLTASLIVDGHHLPPSLVQTFIRAKTPERIILTSDISGLAGLPPGRYGTDLCQLEILASGKLVVAGQSEVLAGASAPLGEAIGRVMDYAGVDLATAVRMAHHNPAELLGLSSHDIQPGDAADLVFFDLVESPHGGRAFTLRKVIAHP